ncbi:NAD-dependent epimerase/dehydratase family protein [Streptomyces avicenniae]|uniref:NAD-dependent epimerase/dehydratase family protein n=1 Tax=Streptomyces avicenniae TaxID=500153 RepID=UPI00069BD414|nr:NAD(P)-dependent oxidoreductase [Streptomyces avicenniae]
MTALRPGDPVLVTGAAGVIGQVVAAHLTAAGFAVTGTDRVPAGPGAGRHLVGDIRDPEFVATCLTGPTGPVAGLVHLAAIPSPGGFPETEILDTNVLGSYTVLDQAARAGVRRIVTASSLSALGLAWADRDLTPAHFPIDEDHPTLAVDAYGLSKVLAEEVAAFTTRRWGTPTISLRFPFVGDGARLQARLDEVAANPAGNRRELWGWLDTRDAAESVAAALRADTDGHHVVNVSAPDTAAQVPTSDLLAAHFPDVPLLRDLPGHAGLFATERAEKLLGFRPAHRWRDTA